MVHALSAFLDFCYLVRHSALNKTTLKEIDNAVSLFHAECVVFEEVGVWANGISMPHRHSILHYRHLTQNSGASNGLCLSITESKHIKVVKEPWRWSNHFNALGQMLLTNQQLDKLTSTHVNFVAWGMLFRPLAAPSVLEPPTEDDKEDMDHVMDHKSRTM
jgi:hypothetical protein